MPHGLLPSKGGAMVKLKAQKLEQHIQIIFIEGDDAIGILHAWAPGKGESFHIPLSKFPKDIRPKKRRLPCHYNVRINIDAQTFDELNLEVVGEVSQPENDEED
jgi:hypothetical protein